MDMNQAGCKQVEEGTILVHARTTAIENIATYGLDEPRGRIVGRHTLYGCSVLTDIRCFIGSRGDAERSGTILGRNLEPGECI